MSLKTTTDAFIAEVLADDPLYPNGTVFIDVEAPDYVQAIDDAICEGRAFLIVFPTGRQQLYMPATTMPWRTFARITWPLRYKALCREVEEMQSIINGRRERPDTVVPTHLSRGHYALAPRRTRHRVA
jgi:hypothetical protein